MKITYLVRRFPVLSETFVINEIADHLKAGAEVSVFALRSARLADFPVDQLGPLFKGRVTYLGGSSRHVARALMQAGITHPVTSLFAASALFQRGGWRKRRELMALAALLGASRSRYDILHCHFGDVGREVAAAIKCARLKVPLVTTVHAFEVSRNLTQPLSELYADFLRDADLVLPVNEVWRTRLIDAGGDPGRIAVHHMGIDPERVIPAPYRTRDIFTLAMTGRIVEKKGHEIAVEALAKLISRRPDLPVHLHLVGGGPLASQIEALIEQRGLGQHIALHGALPHADTLALVANSDALLLPSVTASNGDMEGIPVALMEAMAMEKPVISTRHSGIPELVDHDVTGLLCEERDVEGLSRAIERLADNPDLRLRLGKAGRVRVVTDFNAKKLGIKLRQRYANLLAS